MAKNLDLDGVDGRILSELQTNGRITNQELSDRVGLSPSPCLRRVKQLEAAKIIAGYVALIDPQEVGLDVTAFLRVRLDRQDDRHLEAFERAVARFPQVMDCYLMTGDADYQLRVVVESLTAFEEFLRFQLTKIEGVSQVTSSFALRAVVAKTALPLEIAQRA